MPVPTLCSNYPSLQGSLTCVQPALAIILPWVDFLSYIMTKQLQAHASAYADKSQR